MLLINPMATGTQTLKNLVLPGRALLRRTGRLRAHLSGLC